MIWQEVPGTDGAWNPGGWGVGGGGGVGRRVVGQGVSLEKALKLYLRGKITI